MSKRHSDAIAIQEGACNLSGIAHALIEAFAEIRAEPGFSGTDQLCADPAARLICHQLAFLMGVSEIEHGPAYLYGELVAACKDFAAFDMTGI